LNPLRAGGRNSHNVIGGPHVFAAASDLSLNGLDIRHGFGRMVSVHLPQSANSSTLKSKTRHFVCCSDQEAARISTVHRTALFGFGLLRELGREIDGQRSWLQARIKQAAPQALLVSKSKTELSQDERTI
jgi:hypothetical protein